jgi:hypothetical protein
MPKEEIIGDILFSIPKKVRKRKPPRNPRKGNPQRTPGPNPQKILKRENPILGDVGEFPPKRKPLGTEMFGDPLLTNPHQFPILKISQKKTTPKKSPYTQTPKSPSPTPTNPQKGNHWGHFYFSSPSPRNSQKGNPQPLGILGVLGVLETLGNLGDLGDFAILGESQPNQSPYLAVILGESPFPIQPPYPQTFGHFGDLGEITFTVTDFRST